LASGNTPSHDLGLPAGITPVFLRFRNLKTATLSQQQGLREFLELESRCPEAPEGCETPGPELWNGGPLLWVLDGLDEVIDARARKKVSGWIGRAVKNRPDDWFIVTCRFQGYSK
jgi:predicted NACHT family NTPase